MSYYTVDRDDFISDCILILSAENPMQAVESAVTASDQKSGGKRPLIVFKSAGVVNQSGVEIDTSAKDGSGVATSNPEAIDIDLPMDEEDDNVETEVEGEEVKIIEDLEDGTNSRKLLFEYSQVL